ncbi:MAG: PASTA domain-containing protein [Terriglobales bacterium]
MRKFFRFVLMTLVLVTVAVMSALTAMRVAIHGREVAVPSFVKLSVAEAERVAQKNGLAVSLEGQFYSPDVPEGRIVSQQPPTGTRVRRGWRVRLAQSLGVQRVMIPDVQGQSPRAAELNVRQRGLEIDTVAEAHIPDAPTEQVIAQSPPPAAVGVQSPKLSVLLAVAPDPPAFVMPNFVGRSLEEASDNIEQAGFKLAQVKTDASNTTPSTAPPQPNKSISTTTIVRQSPAAGQKIAADTPIVLEVGR